jgi:hypothetical protein
MVIEEIILQKPAQLGLVFILAGISWRRMVEWEY